jgi:hypothetical protein
VAEIDDKDISVAAPNLAAARERGVIFWVFS